MSQPQSPGSMMLPIVLGVVLLGVVAVVLCGGVLFFSTAPSGASLRMGKAVAVETTASLDSAEAGGAPAARMAMTVDRAKAEARSDAAVSRPQPKPQSGQLTAGAWDDTLNPAWFDRFAAGFSGENPWASAARRVGPRTVIRVRHPQGGLSAARVTVRIGGRQTTLLTGTDGRAILAPVWDGLPSTGVAKVEVTVATLDAPVTVERELGEAVWTIDVPAPKAGAARGLDLALIVDATGSMGDEMRYLQAELASIVRDVRERFGQIEMRFALVVYRDEGDAYVTRSFDFTGDLAAFGRNLAAQRAGGGGDTPEAMDRAIGDAARLSWRDGDVARVAFLVADARPHAGNVGSMLETVDAMRRRGVALYGLAASGIGTQCELLMRIAAVLTGAQYLFLTDDSGVGNPHAEPHIPAYHVQRLDQLLTRVVASELKGVRIEADQRRVIRSVGVMKAGVAAPPAVRARPRQQQ